MKNVIKKCIALLLCCAMLFALSACGQSQQSGGNNSSGSNSSGGNGGGAGEPADNGGGSAGSPAGTPVSAKDTLTVAMTGDNGTLDPYGISGGFIGIVPQYMETLIDYKAGMEKVWVLATDIEELSTSQWIIHLREGVTFSNGNVFNSEDVWFTFEHCLADPVLMRYIPSFDLENSSIIDEYTIDLRLSYYEVTQMDALSMLYILDKESYDEDAFVTNPIGTGPYVISEYVINSHVYMKANPNYWGEKAKIENLHFRILNEDAQQVNAVQAGTVDVTRIPTQDIDYVKTVPGYRVETVFSVYSPNIGFNVSENSVMNDLDARLAVCYATDRQAMIDLVYFGYAELTDYPVSMYCRDYELRLGNLHPTYSDTRDIDKAKELADKAGLTGKDIVVITDGSSSYVTMAEILQANLKDIGVNVVINNYDASSYYTASTDLTLYDLTLNATASPQQLAIGMFYSYVLYTASLSQGGWPGYDRYMELGKAAIANPDAEERKEALYEMTQIFVDAALWYGICDIMTASAVHEDLAGVEFWSNGDCRYVDWYWAS
jgi:peptide/nickel transport system substrate-binding protein